MATRRRQALFIFHGSYELYKQKSSFGIIFVIAVGVYPQNALKLFLGVLDGKNIFGFGDLPATPGTMRNVWRLAGDNFGALVQVATRRRYSGDLSAPPASRRQIPEQTHTSYNARFWFCLPV